MKKSLIILYTFIFFLFKKSQGQYSSLGIDIDFYQERCITEYYKSQTVIIFESNSESKEINTKISAPNHRIIYYNKNSTNIFSFITELSGYYDFCFNNLENKINEVYITIKSGVSANDYSSVAKSKDLEPIDFKLNKILEKENLLEHFNKKSNEKQDMFGFLYKNISNKIITYSILLIVGMILIGIVEMLYLKRFMEKRKII